MKVKTPTLSDLGRAYIEALLSRDRAEERVSAALRDIRQGVYSVQPSQLRRMKSEAEAEIPLVERARTELEEAVDRTIVTALGRVDIVEAAESYEFRPDVGCHTPTDFEKTLLIDFAHGLMGEVHAALRPLLLATSQEP